MMPMDSQVLGQSWIPFKRLQPLLSIALGLFITAQALFLPIANLLEFQTRLRTLLEDKPWAKSWAPDWLDEKGPTCDVLEQAEQTSQRWQELTGQPQNWSLFAPEVADDIWFMGVKVHQFERNPNEDQEQKGYCFTYLSDNEPSDPNCFFRLGHFRVRRYEMAIEVHLYDYPNETAQEKAEFWRDKIRERVRKDWDNMEAYLRYRLQCFKRLHPDLPEPDELILTVRHFDIPPPEQVPFRWGEPVETPVARWRPKAHLPDDALPVERYDPVSNRFLRVNR
jgi:hypothetical protein